MKLKYRITIGNAVLFILLLFSTFILLKSKDPNNLIGARYILFFSIFLFLGDLFLQWIIENDKIIFLIEGIILSVIITFLVLS